MSNADDTVLFLDGNSWEEVETKLKMHLEIIKWFDDNLLTINMDKTVYLPISSYKNGLPNTEQLDLYLPFRNNTYYIQSTTNTKYLRITMNNDLK